MVAEQALVCLQLLTTPGVCYLERPGIHVYTTPYQGFQHLQIPIPGGTMQRCQSLQHHVV